MASRSLLIENLSDKDFLNPMPASITAIFTTFFSILLKWYFWMPTKPVLSLCSRMFWQTSESATIKPFIAFSSYPRWVASIACARSLTLPTIKWMSSLFCIEVISRRTSELLLLRYLCPENPPPPPFVKRG